MPTAASWAEGAGPCAPAVDEEDGVGATFAGAESFVVVASVLDGSRAAEEVEGALLLPWRLELEEEDGEDSFPLPSRWLSSSLVLLLPLPLLLLAKMPPPARLTSGLRWSAPLFGLGPLSLFTLSDPKALAAAWAKETRLPEGAASSFVGGVPSPLRFVAAGAAVAEPTSSVEGATEVDELFKTP